MAEQIYQISELSFVSDVVAHDYRTADVFRKYDIDFCCGGRWALHIVCQIKGLNTEDLLLELRQATRVIHVSPALPFNEWPLEFLADYIVYVHHAYLRKALPETKGHLEKFVGGHRKKYPYLDELQQEFLQLSNTLLPHLDHEEGTLFPYIRQISRAASSGASYGGLLVRTLRKPVEEIMQHEHESITRALHLFRQLSSNYTPPEHACISHRVVFSKLRELDNDIMQHMHLENNILFPGAIAVEKELLQKKN